MSLHILIEALNSFIPLSINHKLINPFVNEFSRHIEARSIFQITFIKNLRDQIKCFVTDLINRFKKIIELNDTLVILCGGLDKRLIKYHYIIGCLIDQENAFIIVHDERDFLSCLFIDLLRVNYICLGIIFILILCNCL